MSTLEDMLSTWRLVDLLEVEPWPTVWICETFHTEGFWKGDRVGLKVVAQG